MVYIKDTNNLLNVLNKYKFQYPKINLMKNAYFLENDRALAMIASGDNLIKEKKLMMLMIDNTVITKDRIKIIILMAV